MRTHKIVYHERTNSLGFRFPYSEKWVKIFSSLGYRFHAGDKEWRKTFSKSDFFLTLALDKRWEKSESFLKLEQDNAEALLAARIKRGELSPKYQGNDLKMTPLDHQKIGVDFIRACGGRCIINDDQGTGKTLQGLAYFHDVGIPAAVLVPKHLVANWEREIDKTFFSQSSKNLFRVMNMDSLDRKALEELERGDFGLIVDESHNIHSLKSKRFKEALRVAKKARAVVLLTGHNFDQSPIDLYPQLKLIGESITKKQFMGRFFQTSFENMKTRIIRAHTKAINFAFAHLKIRRSLSQLGTQERKGKNYELNISLSSDEKKSFCQAFHDDGIFFTGAAVMRLNKINSLLKTKYVVKFIKNEITQNSETRIAVFSQFKEALEDLKSKYPMMELYREDKAPGSRVVLVDSSKYREGIDLSFCDTIVMLDVFADKNKNLQIKRRINRIGQEKDTVRCYYALAGLIDEVLYKIPKYYGYEKALQNIRSSLKKICS